MEEEAQKVTKKIEEDFKELNEQEIEKFFDNFRNDTGTKSFIKFYNRTVLDKERIDFGEFKRQWAIQGMTQEVYNHFDENFDRLKKEIIREKNIKPFFQKYCSRESVFQEHCNRKRNEVSFCSKLFHTFLPDEFPPLDSGIRDHFELKNEINSILILKNGYELFKKENPETINSIRTILSKDKFSYLRINELSDIRILDMYYWFKNRKTPNEFI